MTRREILSAATAAPIAALAVGSAAASPPHQAPTMQQLISLAESARSVADRTYYGRVLAEALSETGRIANDNDDDTISLYEAELSATWAAAALGLE